MPVREEAIRSWQGYSIVRITETDARDHVVVETFAVTHPSCGAIAEFAQVEDAVGELNRMLLPLPGLPAAELRDAL